MNTKNNNFDQDLRRNKNNRLNEGHPVGKYAVEIERRLQKLEKEKPLLELPNTICLSRQIGTGALGIAEILGQNLGCFVADRELVTKIARNGYHSQRTVRSFDERYPGKMNELMSKFFSVRPFDFKDYMQYLIAVIYTLAETGPTIFVGRGAHLILPREYILGVRLIASMHYRIKRAAHLYSLGEGLAEEKLKQMDREQKDFFRRAFGIMEPSPSEFDLVINLDHFPGHQGVASVIEHAYRQKFGV
jgi:hypothetical protein